LATVCIIHIIRQFLIKHIRMLVLYIYQDSMALNVLSHYPLNKKAKLIGDGN